MKKAKQNVTEFVEQANSNKYIMPKSSYVTVKHNPSMTKQWSNGVYNFNNNLIKNIPSADKVVSKMIKNFFTINPLSYNRQGKKSKLLNRRYKRLSLNRILASKPEIKHDNNKVNITVFLFNKKKISLLKTLNTKRNNLTKGRKAIALSWTLPNKGIALVSKSNFNKNTYLYKLAKRLRNFEFLKTKTKSIINDNYTPNRRLSRLGYLNKNAFYYNTKFVLKNPFVVSLNSKSKINKFNNKTSLFNKWLFNNKSIFSRRNYYTLLNNKRNGKYIYLHSRSISKARNKFIDHKSLSSLTKNAIYKFLIRDNNTAYKNDNLKNYILERKNYGSKNFIKMALQNYYEISNKYKLLNKPSSVYNDRNSTTLSVNESIKINNSYSGILNNNMSSLKAIYKLFILSNKINSSKVSLYNSTSDSLDNFMKSKLKIRSIFNRIRVKKSKKYRLASSIRKMDREVLKVIYPGKNIKDTKRIYLKSALSTASKAMLKTIYNKPKLLKKDKLAYQQSVIVRYNILLMKKIEKIDNFIKRYSNALLHNESNKGYNGVSLITINNINNLYKSMYIKDILHKETMYLHYMKLISYNDALFKSWLLMPLKNIISKVYNKKVILNLVNLKYIHLNSDILLEAMALRLRNIKKNKLNKVLRKTLSLVKISKVNSYIKDINHPVYNYIEQHFNKFKHLNNAVFNDIKNSSNSKNISVLTSSIYNPISTKWLDHIQTNTINFIKYKTVFGLKLEASGRLTKRSTASRSIFKFRYKGGLKNNTDISRIRSSTVIKSNMISNLQYSKISSKTRNGSFGLKSWINNN